jgi:hypothetical protein
LQCRRVSNSVLPLKGENIEFDANESMVPMEQHNNMKEKLQKDIIDLQGASIEKNNADTTSNLLETLYQNFYFAQTGQVIYFIQFIILLIYITSNSIFSFVL